MWDDRHASLLSPLLPGRAGRPGLFDRSEFDFDALGGRLEDLRKHSKHQDFNSPRLPFKHSIPDPGGSASAGAAPLP